MVIKFKKYRHKPLYKNFVSLKKNIQNRRRLNLLKFNKNKWEKLISYLKRLQIRRKKNYRMYDVNKYYLPKFYNSFKKKYQYLIQTRKKYKLFYGSLRRSSLKRSIGFTLKQKSKLLKNFINPNHFFLGLMEKRIDAILYRSQFVPSFRAAHQLVSHRHILINNVVVTDSSHILKKGDVIKISKKVQNLVDFNIRNSHIWPLPPKYLQINYRTLEILILDNFENSNYSIYYPFWVDVYTLIRYYK